MAFNPRMDDALEEDRAGEGVQVERMGTCGKVTVIATLTVTTSRKDRNNDESLVSSKRKKLRGLVWIFVIQEMLRVSRSVFFS